MNTKRCWWGETRAWDLSIGGGDLKCWIGKGKWWFLYWSCVEHCELEAKSRETDGYVLYRCWTPKWLETRILCDRTEWHPREIHMSLV